MYTCIQNRFSICVAAGILMLSLTSLPALSEDLSENLGPVGPHAPILTTVGSKRVIAFYQPEGESCGMHIVVWDTADLSGGSAARVRLALGAGQTVHIDSPDNKTLDLQCGESADQLAIVDNTKVRQKWTQAV